jgi:hypothetical protein
MHIRRNDFDVTNRIQTTDPAAVEREINRLFRLLYPGASHQFISLAFSDVLRLYSGTYPGYLACDTSYHDLQHVMEVTLAMARLIDGYERSRRESRPFGVALFQLGIVVSLFHDMGYLRKECEHATRNGATFTVNHVSRGAEFLRGYLPLIGMGRYAEAGAELIHFTGYEKRVGEILIADPVLRLLGSLLGSADIIAQMADRCYLEKCRDRLYPEFVEGGLAVKQTEAGEQIVFASGDDLVNKTPAFFDTAVHRLEEDLGGAHNYAASHFGGFNLYLQAANRNVHFARQVSSGERAGLRRAPPEHVVESNTIH